MNAACEMNQARGSRAKDRNRVRDQTSVHQHDPDLDDQALRDVASLIQATITPQVAIEPLDDRPWAGQSLHQADSLLCDISGATHLFGSETNLLAAVKAQLARHGLFARVAIADNVAAAWALAHYGQANEIILPPGSSSPQVSAPTAPQSSGNQILASGNQIPRLIQQLPVQALRIAPQTVATLDRLGVQQIGSLLRLPRGGLATRLGKPLVKRISQLLGETKEPLNFHHAPAQYTYAVDLEYPSDDERILADRITRLADQIKDGLAASHRGALRITCYLTLSDHPPHSFEVGLFAPTQDSKQLSCLLVSCLQSRQSTRHGSLPSLVSRITLQVTHSAPLRSSQPVLFSDDEPIGTKNSSFANRSSLPHLINTLSGRLGRDSVLSVSVNDNPLPEQSFRLAPLTGGSKRNGLALSYFNKRNRSRHTIAPTSRDAMRRPLLLLPQPQPLSPVHSSGTHSSSHHKSNSAELLPVGFRLGGIVHQVVRCWGPERIETGWWDGPCTRRDYFRIETDTGRWWWIFRNLGNQSHQHRWMLHGRFA